MTYDYEEFLNQFAGVEKYKKGKKVKSCCGGKKVVIAEEGAKTKKKLESHSSINDDENDDALLEFLNAGEDSTAKSTQLSTQLTNKSNWFNNIKLSEQKKKLQKRIK